NLLDREGAFCPFFFLRGLYLIAGAHASCRHGSNAVLGFLYQNDLWKRLQGLILQYHYQSSLKTHSLQKTFAKIHRRSQGSLCRPYIVRLYNFREHWICKNICPFICIVIDAKLENVLTNIKPYIRLCKYTYYSHFIPYCKVP